MEDKLLVNRVASSGLVTLNLEQFFPKEPLAIFDLKEYLFMALILKEKDFRESMRAHNWSQYDGQNLAVYCSADAIVPIWAYMLVASYAAPHAVRVCFGDADAFYQSAYATALAHVDGAAYKDQRVVIKGCSDYPVPASAYLEITRLLQPFALSIMYGEPCSTVPIFKRPKVVTA